MDKRKHVCLIYEFLSEQGGLEREIINHANFLKESGYKVTILTCHLDKKILTLLPFDNLEIQTIGKFNTGIESLDMALCFLGLNNLNKYNPDFFLSYSFPSNYLIKNKTSKKINYINHYPHFLYLNENEKNTWSSSTQGIKRKIASILSLFIGKRLKQIDKNLVTKNNLNFTNSQFTKRRLDKMYNMDSVISYPPLDKTFKPSKNKINKKFLFSSSRIIPDKKYEWLLESMKHMKNKIPLYLAGTVEPNYKTKLIGLANKNKLDIKFLGRLTTEQIKDYYTNAEAFVFPTPEEDFGLVPAESLSCGTPCIVWGDDAGPTEQIIDGINGFHAKPYDFKDFGNKIDLVIDKKLKSKNQKIILNSSKKFSYSEIKKDFMKHINSII
jgi:glycosyltransferase involved in cell wall biosynthesis